MVYIQPTNRELTVIVVITTDIFVFRTFAHGIACVIKGYARGDEILFLLVIGYTELMCSQNINISLIRMILVITDHRVTYQLIY